MNTFRQHIPTFVEIDGPPPLHKFSTTQELLALDVLQRYKGDDFSHFSMSGNLLMAISDDGFDWWVVGRISDPGAVDLPMWEGWKFRAQLGDGTEAVLSTEVVSSCGDVLTLRDGTSARNTRPKD